MLSLFSCSHCGKIVLTVQDGVGTLGCCGQPMSRMNEKTTESGREKHQPVISVTPGGIHVNVGEQPHPMDKDHYIKWIEVIGDTFLYTASLEPGEKPELEFFASAGNHAGKVRKVRACCNVHGIWANRP